MFRFLLILVSAGLLLAFAPCQAKAKSARSDRLREVAWPLQIEAGVQVDVGPSFWKGCFAVKSVLMKRKISPPAVAQRPASLRRHLQARGRMLLGFE